MLFIAVRMRLTLKNFLHTPSVNFRKLLIAMLLLAAIYAALFAQGMVARKGYDAFKSHSNR